MQYSITPTALAALTELTSGRAEAIGAADICMAAPGALMAHAASTIEEKNLPMETAPYGPPDKGRSRRRTSG